MLNSILVDGIIRNMGQVLGHSSLYCLKVENNTYGVRSRLTVFANSKLVKDWVQVGKAIRLVGRVEQGRKGLAIIADAILDWRPT